MNWTALFQNLADSPTLYLIGLVVLIVMFFLFRIFRGNEIGDVKAKKTKIVQSGKKSNTIKSVKSDEVDIHQR